MVIGGRRESNQWVSNQFGNEELTVAAFPIALPSSLELVQLLELLMIALPSSFITQRSDRINPTGSDRGNWTSDESDPNQNHDASAKRHRIVERNAV